MEMVTVLIIVTKKETLRQRKHKPISSLTSVIQPIQTLNTVAKATLKLPGET